jgi:hypothetical protein
MVSVFSITGKGTMTCADRVAVAEEILRNPMAEEVKRYG